MELMIGCLSIFHQVGAEQKPMPTPDLSHLESPMVVLYPGKPHSCWPIVWSQDIVL